MAYKQMPILLAACMATAVAADCQDPNQAVVEVVKGYAASGHIDNYAIEKYGHGDKMAVIVSKKTSVSPGNESIGQYINALIKIRMAGCEMGGQEKNDLAGGGGSKDGELTLSNTLLCTCGVQGKPYNPATSVQAAQPQSAQQDDGAEDSAAEKTESRHQQTSPQEFF